jgi:2-oxo-4-hydroxy-4-carboxy-5-ureidoimidazoline decarboxylase
LPNSATTLEQLNAFDRERFVAALGWIFEDSPWVAERAWERRPFARLDDLHAAMTREVAAATPDEQLALLRAHPDLGARARMSRASTSEQAGAGLDRLGDEDFERLQRLNAAYREKFGYPFLLAVTGRTTHQILDALTRRLPADPQEEFAEALREVYRIARVRLDAIIR